MNNRFMIKCSICNQVKSWKGDEIACPINTGDITDNWMCGTILQLRRLILDPIDDDAELPEGTSYQACYDEHYATFRIDRILNEEYLTLWISWYKGRGRTQQLWLLSADEDPVKPSMDQLRKILEYYKPEIKKS